MNEKTNVIYITTPYITLGQFLKLSNLITTGGATKQFLASNKIVVDGILETRRGKKLYPGTVVVFASTAFEIKSK